MFKESKPTPCCKYVPWFSLNPLEFGSLFCPAVRFSALPSCKFYAPRKRPCRTGIGSLKLYLSENTAESVAPYRVAQCTPDSRKPWFMQYPATFVPKVALVKTRTTKDATLWENKTRAVSMFQIIVASLLNLNRAGKTALCPPCRNVTTACEGAKQYRLSFLTPHLKLRKTHFRIVTVSSIHSALHLAQKWRRPVENRGTECP